MDQVSPYLSGQVASLLTTDPERRPTAEQLLHRLNGERDEVSGRSKQPQYQRPVEQDDDDDSDHDTLVQTKHQPTVKPQEKMAPVRSPRSESSAARHQPSSDPPFLLVTSTGPAADYQGGKLGLYRKTEQRTEGRTVYIQEHDSQYDDSPCKLSSDNKVWVVNVNCDDGYEGLRAATHSDGPTSVSWQYKESRHSIWRDDPALTVTGLSEKPSSECEVTISLSWKIKDIVTNILEPIVDPGVAGVYRADGSYCRGRPVLQHSVRLFTLSVGGWGRWWVVETIGRGPPYLSSGSAPSQCPADPRAARRERRGETHWQYLSKQWEWTKTSGISVKCNKCVK